MSTTQHLAAVARKRAGGGSVNGLLSSLTSYWKLDEASGTRDDAHSTNDLSDVGTTPAAAGKLNDGANFDGSTQYLTIADNASLSLAADTDFSISCWVKADDLSVYREIVSKDTVIDGTGSEYNLLFDQGAGKFDLLVGNGASFQRARWSAAANIATWYHIVCWHDSAANVVGITVNDGTPVTAAWSGGTQNTAAPFRIGASGNAGALLHFDGIIDEVGFWKGRVLSAANITALYGAGTPPAYSTFD
jgi:hypothetical protein